MKFAEKLVYVSYQSTSTSQKIVEFGSMFNMFVFNLKYIFLMLPDKILRGAYIVTTYICPISEANVFQMIS